MVLNCSYIMLSEKKFLKASYKIIYTFSFQLDGNNPYAQKNPGIYITFKCTLYKYIHYTYHEHLPMSINIDL